MYLIVGGLGGLHGEGGCSVEERVFGGIVVGGVLVEEVG